MQFASLRKRRIRLVGEEEAVARQFRRDSILNRELFAADRAPYRESRRRHAVSQGVSRV